MEKIFSFIGKHKKSIIVVCCVMIIGISVYSDFMINRNNDEINTGSYIYNSDTTQESTKILGEAKLVDNMSDTYSEDTEAYFLSAQLNRQRSRDEALETLQVVIDSSETMPDVKDEALNRMISIASEIETEAIVEEMIKAKGFEDCLAVMTGEKINVIVKTPGLLTSEVAQITEIVTQETGFSPENIVIVVVDRLENIEKYASLNPLFAQAIEFLKSHDLNALEVGKTELKGRELLVNVAQTKPKTKEDAKLETHRDFIDIQIPLSGTEIMGYTAAKDCVPADAPYNAEKDITFFSGLAESYIEVKPGMFAIFFPQDGHAPGITPDGVKKVIVKVKA